MKKKKGLLWIILGLIVLIAIIVGSIFLIKNRDKKEDEKKTTETKEEVKTSQATPLFYKVTKDGSDNVIYLLGSIHAADDRAYPMRKEIMDAYNNSDYLAVEVDTIALQKDYNMMIQALQSLVVERGKTLKDYMSSEVYEETIKYLKDNKVYNAAYEYYKPAFIYTLVSSIYVEKSGLSSAKGIDMYFLNQAYKDKKNILEYESAEFQYKVIGSLSDRLSEILIYGSIIEEKEAIDQLKKLYESWLKGDEEGILSSSDDEVDEDNPLYKEFIDEVEKFNKLLVDDRNKDMFTKTKEFMNSEKNVFVVVGSLHVLGEEGLAKQLKNAGYNVELVEYKNN